MLKNVREKWRQGERGIHLGDVGTAVRCGNRCRIYQNWCTANAGRKIGLDKTG